MKLLNPKRPRIDRRSCIRIIEDLYPADSSYPDTRRIGQKFFDQAKDSCANWRDAPDCVLFEYMRLCLEKHNRATDHLLQKMR